MPRAVITHGYSPAPRRLTVLRCRHQVLAVCASVFLVVAAVATAVIIVSQWQQNSHTAHNVLAQSNTWVRVEKAHALVRRRVRRVFHRCHVLCFHTPLPPTSPGIVRARQCEQGDATVLFPGATVAHRQ